MKENSYYQEYPEKLSDPNEIKEFCIDLLHDPKKEKKDFDYLFGEGDIPDGKIVIGKLLSYIRSEDPAPDPLEAPVDELVEKIKDIQEKIGDTSEIKIYSGSMLC